MVKSCSQLESCQPRAIAPPCPSLDFHARYFVGAWPSYEPTIPDLSLGPACQPSQQPEAHPPLLPLSRLWSEGFGQED